MGDIIMLVIFFVFTGCIVGYLVLCCLVGPPS